MAEYIKSTGVETTLAWHLNYNDDYINYSQNSTPYHYFDLWIHITIITFSALNGILAFNFLTIPFITGIGFYALSALGHSIYRNINKVSIYLLSLLSVFFIGVLPFKWGGWDDNLFFFPRTISIYLPIVLSFLFMYNKSFNTGLILLTTSAFFHILYAPSVLCTVFIIGVVNYLWLKSNLFSKSNLIITTLSGLFIFSFYFLMNTSQESDVLNSKGVLDYLSVQNFIPTLFKRYLLRIPIYFYPMAIYFLFRFNRIKESLFCSSIPRLILICAFVLICSSIFFSSLINHIEAVSFSNGILTTTFGIGTFIAVVNEWNSKKSHLNKLLIILLTIGGIYNTYYTLIPNKFNKRNIGASYSKEFIKSIQNNQVIIKNKVGGLIQNTEFRNINMYSNHPHGPRHSAFFDFNFSEVTLVSISTPSELSEVKFEEIHEIIAFAPFYKFVQSQKKYGEYINKSQSQIDFIKKYNIEFLIVEPGGIVSNQLNELIDLEYIDKPKGYKIIYLKKSILSNE